MQNVNILFMVNFSQITLLPVIFRWTRGKLEPTTEATRLDVLQIKVFLKI